MPDLPRPVLTKDCMWLLRKILGGGDEGEEKDESLECDEEEPEQESMRDSSDDDNNIAGRYANGRARR
eukprot:2025707-Pleurochrysis_carterae.AAC.1